MAARCCLRTALTSLRAWHMTSSHTLSPSALPLLSAPSALPLLQVPSRHMAFRYVDVPEPGVGKTQYRYRVDLPQQYTVTKLPIQKLGGRDPVTGRVVVGTLGGGSKQKFRWLDTVMRPLADGSPRRELVVNLVYDPLRTCRLATVAHGDQLRYIIAHEEMQPGDIVTTYGNIPDMPVRPKVGDSHPLGALPPGTMVFNIEIYRDHPERMCVNGGTYGTVLRRVDKKVILQMPSKRQFSFREDCMCTVGRVAMRVPAIRPIGSAQRLRHLGYRPRSGLKQRKTGRFGRKVRRLPPLRDYREPPKQPAARYQLSLRDKDVPGNDIGQMFPSPHLRGQQPLFPPLWN